MVEHDVKDLNLAAQGKKRIEWADADMPVLRAIRERFEKEKPLAGKKMSACLHVTAETANLARTLKAGGADLVLVASNPLSTQDDVAASLVKDYGVSVHAINGEDTETYYKHIKAALEHDPVVTMDDGADLVSTLHADYPEKVGNVLGSMEETTTGIIRLRAMHKDGALKIPVFAVNDAQTKYLFDNRYGTGQSTVDGIIRATDFLVAGKKVVVAGYGWCGKGFAMRMKGMGANVIVTEVDPIKALEAAMDGYWVMPMAEAAKIGDLFVTITGDIHVLRGEHFALMKDGAIIANSGHFNVEININELEKMAKGKNENVRNYVDEYVMEDGRRLYLLAQGRLINLAAAEGHPASVMDMSFATQALTTEYMVQHKMPVAVHEVPEEIENWIATAKLKSMGVEIDELTEEQKEYLASWQLGT
ncbi:MAG TPA: adenosylhomocysteinase [Caldithrix abyssi]|uniref:Adenosylhomocysteinase n=1 Tax=Caldithrix abyssi TaxID=187145 RepID=A0A7V4WW83_CALAY|nr:adenosylhomocysteinase [Caldithrix abyssi]